MNTRHRRTGVMLAACALGALALNGPLLADESAEEARLVTAAQVLESSGHSGIDQRIPSWLMQRAYGVAVIPEVINLAVGVGGRRGRGVMSVRDAGGRFGNPFFVTLTGGSVGFQFGAQASDVVLVFVTERSVENFKKGNFTLGVNASVAAGPVGRQGEAAAGVTAEVYSYSRTRGLFYSLAFNGTAMLVDRRANKHFYGRAVNPDDVSKGLVSTSSPAAGRFIASIAATLPAGAPGAAPAAGGSSAPAVSTPAPTTTGGSSSSGAAAPAQTFPLEDQAPGGEPH